MPYKDPEKAKAAKKKWDDEHRVGKRHTVWLAIFYPQDLESDDAWQQDLEENGVPCLVSPLHDRDTWTAHDEKKNAAHKAGSLKVPHRHIVAEYPNAVPYEQFRADFSFLSKDGNGPKSVKYAKDIAASSAYLDHGTKACERAGKAKYDPDEILEFCGADYRDWVSRTVNVHEAMKAMRAYIRENDVREFTDFQDWCDEERDDWSRLLDLKCAWPIGNYIDKRRAKAEKEAQRQKEEERRAEFDRKCAEFDEAYDRIAARSEASDGIPPVGGLSATPPQGASEPRTPNPDEEPQLEGLGESEGALVPSEPSEPWVPAGIDPETGEVLGAANDDVAPCSWCGAPSTGGSVGPLGAFYWCDEHFALGLAVADELQDNSGI